MHGESRIARQWILTPSEAFIQDVQNFMQDQNGCFFVFF